MYLEQSEQFYSDWSWTEALFEASEMSISLFMAIVPLSQLELYSFSWRKSKPICRF